MWGESVRGLCMNLYAQLSNCSLPNGIFIISTFLSFWKICDNHLTNLNFRGWTWSWKSFLSEVVGVTFTQRRDNRWLAGGRLMDNCIARLGSLMNGRFALETAATRLAMGDFPYGNRRLDCQASQTTSDCLTWNEGNVENVFVCENVCRKYVNNSTLLHL